MTIPFSFSAPLFKSGSFHSAMLVGLYDPLAAAAAPVQPVVAGALYLLEDPRQRTHGWQRLWLDQKQAPPVARAALLVALAEAINSLAELSDRTRAITQVLLDLPGLPPAQQVELVAALAEQIGAQPAVAFRKATFDDVNTLVAQFEGRFRHAAYVHILANIECADAVTVDHVFSEILRCCGGLGGASGATLVKRLAATIRRLPAARRLACFASLNSVLRHASIAQQVELDVAMLG